MCTFVYVIVYIYVCVYVYTYLINIYCNIFKAKVCYFHYIYHTAHTHAPTYAHTHIYVCVI